MYGFWYRSNDQRKKDSVKSGQTRGQDDGVEEDDYGGSTDEDPVETQSTPASSLGKTGDTGKKQLSTISSKHQNKLLKIKLGIIVGEFLAAFKKRSESTVLNLRGRDFESLGLQKLCLL